jgi:hypothetical protein
VGLILAFRHGHDNNVAQFGHHNALGVVLHRGHAVGLCRPSEKELLLGNVLEPLNGTIVAHAEDDAPTVRVGKCNDLLCNPLGTRHTALKL